MPRVRSSLPPRVAALVVFGSAFLATSGAFAFERQWHVGVKGGFADLAKRPVGPAVGLHGAYGLSDMFDVAFEGLASRHGWTRGTDVFSASLGMVYKIDIFEWIPYAGILGGYYHYTGLPGPHGESGSEIGGAVQLGLDYLLVREVAIGADLRWHASFHDGMTMPLYTGTLGVEYRWGY